MRPRSRLQHRRRARDQSLPALDPHRPAQGAAPRPPREAPKIYSLKLCGVLSVTLCPMACLLASLATQAWTSFSPARVGFATPELEWSSSPSSAHLKSVIPERPLNRTSRNQE